MRHSEPLTECKAHIFQISARTMDQNHGRVCAGSVARQAEHGHMQPNTLNLNKLSRWRMHCLEPCDSEGRCRCKHANDQREYQEIEKDRGKDTGHDAAR